MVAVLPVILDGNKKRQFNPATDTVAGLTNTVLSVNGLTGTVVLTTTEVSEGTNLYFTNERVDDRVASLIQNGTGLNWSYSDAGNIFTGNVTLAPFTTSDLAEGSNLYFTDERVDDRVSVLIQDAGGIRKSYNDAGNTLTLNTAFATQLLCVVDQKATGTNGGSFTSGAWRTRDLNTIRTNEIAGASVATNRITLPAGTYFIEWSADAASDNDSTEHKTRIRNITDNTTILVGSGGYMDGAIGLSTALIQSKSCGKGRFTIAATKVIELQHQISVTQNTNGFGVAAGFGEVEVYSQVSVWKVG